MEDEDWLTRQLYPGYQDDAKADQDEFDQTYSKLMLDRFKYNQDRDHAFLKKLTKLKGNIRHLQKISSHKAGEVAWDLETDEEAAKKKNHSKHFGIKKQSNHPPVNPREQLKDTIKDDVRFAEILEEIIHLEMGAAIKSRT